MIGGLPRTFECEPSASPAVMAGPDPSLPGAVKVVQLSALITVAGMTGTDPRNKCPGTAMTGKRAPACLLTSPNSYPSAHGAGP